MLETAMWVVDIQGCPLVGSLDARRHERDSAPNPVDNQSRHYINLFVIARVYMYIAAYGVSGSMRVSY